MHMHMCMHMHMHMCMCMCMCMYVFSTVTRGGSRARRAPAEALATRHEARPWLLGTLLYAL